VRSGFWRRAPTGVRDNRPGTGTRADPEPDLATFERNRRQRPPFAGRHGSGRNKRFVRHSDGWDPGNGTEVNCESAATRMVEPSCIHEQNVGFDVEHADRIGKKRTLPSCEKTGHVGSGHAAGHHGLGDDVISTAR
jgi:hypothetical protein